MTRQSLGVDGPERAGQGAVGELGDLTGDFDAGRTGADDDESEPAFTLGGVGGDLGGLERAEDASAVTGQVACGA